MLRGSIPFSSRMEMSMITKRLLALAQDVANGRKPVPTTEQEVGALM